jgi:hypothetical protein
MVQGVGPEFKPQYHKKKKHTPGIQPTKTQLAHSANLTPSLLNLRRLT